MRQRLTPISDACPLAAPAATPHDFACLAIITIVLHVIGSSTVVGRIGLRRWMALSDIVAAYFVPLVALGICSLATAFSTVVGTLVRLLCLAAWSSALLVLCPRALAVV